MWQVPFLLLGFVGEDLFTIAFGADWSEAGVYAQILSFCIFLRFITAPASYLVLIFEKQEYSLFLNAVDILTCIAAVTIGGLLGNVYISFLFLSGLTGILYGVYGFWFMNLAGLTVSKVLQTLLLNFVKISPVIIAIAVSKWHLNLSSFLLIILSGVGVIIFYGIVLRTDEVIRSLIVRTMMRLQKRIHLSMIA